MDNTSYGVVGNTAHKWSDSIEWIDSQGNETSPISLSDFTGKVKIIYGFQSWCPGCHSRGLPALKQLVDHFGNENPNITFLAIQTVFEGFDQNSKEKINEVQKKYELAIPFGHDIGSDETNKRSEIMYHYRTGGTPWFIFIDENDQVIFNDFHINTEGTIQFFDEYFTKKQDETL